MKKALTLILALALGLGLKAQCTLTTAVDFTATDVHGNEIHLFDILDGGQYVLLDFFYTTCSACTQTTPYVAQSYQAFGCNQHDVFYIEIDDGDSDMDCLGWVNTYGIEYPTISGMAGGTSICNTYGISYFPTVILIAPDRSIVINDLWPITNAQSVISALEQHGIEQHVCGGQTLDPGVTISVDQVNYTEVTATFTPNAYCTSYAYTLATEAEIQEWMNIAGLDLPEYVWTYGIPGEGTLSNTFTDLTPDTEYVIYAVPADANGNLGEVATETVVTTPTTTDEIIPDFTTTDIDGNEIHLYDILDGGQWALIHFFLAAEEFNDEYSLGLMHPMTEAYRLFGCNENDVFFMEITADGNDSLARAWAERHGVEYPTISRAGGGSTIAQSIPVGWYPTVMLVRPDHVIARRDIYPINHIEFLIETLESFGIEQHECPVVYDETLTFSTDTIYVESMELVWITVYNNTAENAIVTKIQNEPGSLMFTFDGEELFYAHDLPEFTIPQGESLELGLYLDEIAKYIIPEVITLSGNLPDASFVAMVDHPESINENESSINLFPNPANDFVTLKGESLGTVRVFNALGQKVDEFEANGNELRISTVSYENGIYFVKANEKTMKFVVKH
ncbi:MAG: redoxin domain-containing protein [Bacteroidales bacterium]|nr:redoxin domain-containing protein [Bacteroidales bacterium]